MRYLTFITLLFLFPSANAEGPLRILLTNDDGYDSPGIRAMYNALIADGHDVWLIAPATQQSGASASVSARGVKLTPYPNKVWAVHGRPADAVRVGLGNLMFDNPPDLVVSGANFGHNTGQDVSISGTVGAAVTALKLGVPAIALSVEIKLDEAERKFPSTMAAFSGAGRLLARLIRNLDLQDLTAVLNVNYPAQLPLDVKGVRWSKLSDHSLLGKRYNRLPDGTYAPELIQPYKHARKNDAESLVDGWVTLTFLDGDIAVATHRRQKYLDEGLIDAHYEAVYQPAPRQVTPDTAKPEPAPVIATPSEPADEQVVEFETAAPAPTPRAAIMKTSEPKKRQAPTAPIEQALDVKQTAALAEPADPVVTETRADEVVAAETDKIEDGPVPAQAQKRKKKPDSWLRRMFDPKSWRR